MPPVNTEADELRRQYKAWWREWHRVNELRRALMITGARQRGEYFLEYGVWPPPTELPPYPACPPELEGLSCGAWGRQRQRPCQSKQIFENGRCRLHGGASTGPKSAEGKARSASNLPGASK